MMVWSKHYPDIFVFDYIRNDRAIHNIVIPMRLKAKVHVCTFGGVKAHPTSVSPIR